MAEEQDIRSIWNKSKKLEDPSSLKINRLEKKGTKTTLYWIKVILWIEFWLNIIITPIFVPYLLKRGDSIGFIAFITSITFIYLIYYQFLIRKINRFSYDGNVIKSLKKVYGYLRFFLLHYKVVIWISMIIGVVHEFSREKYDEVLNDINTQEDWIAFILINLLVMGVIGGLMHLIINLIYGRKIKRLKRMVQDLESEE